MPRDELKEVISTLAMIIHRERDKLTISPAWVADAGLAKMDPERKTPFLVRKTALFELRQLARQLLRKHFEPEDFEEEDEDRPDPLFPELQWRYPQARMDDESPRYVLLNRMTPSDVKYNIGRLRKCGDGMHRHADALEKYWREKGVA